ncbi:MAG TPA: hypothetical protein VGX48_26500 [Pyrinomonadaceae bacterium]|jgi:hypothetical protein|nr:hypothetical protein [Pyrinomonadaceae bacterium]
MKRLHKAIISFGFAIMLVAASGSALAITPSQQQRLLTGTIIGVDRAARTITVRENGSNQITRIQVPERRRIRTAQQSNPFADFNQLQAGMVVRDVLVY